MNATHTPGPWMPSGTYIDGAHYQHMAIYDQDWTPIAQVNGHSGELNRNTANANARLIASAPDLLAALELAVATIERLGKQHGPFSSFAGTLNVANAAIARAKGGQP